MKEPRRAVLLIWVHRSNVVVADGKQSWMLRISGGEGPDEHL